MNKTLRSLLSAALCLAALSVSLGGCTGNDATDEILNRLDTMQQELDDLKTGVEGSDATGSTDSGTGGSQSDSTDSQSADTDATDFEATFADLESRVDEAVATADAVEVPGNVGDRPQAYFEATRPLESLDDEIDMLDDQIEAAFHAGTIDRDAMWSLEQRLDAMDDKLDDAKDSLEWRMGVDD